MNKEKNTKKLEPKKRQHMERARCSRPAGSPPGPVKRREVWYLISLPDTGG